VLVLFPVSGLRFAARILSFAPRTSGLFLGSSDMLPGSQIRILGFARRVSDLLQGSLDWIPESQICSQGLRFAPRILRFASPMGPIPFDHKGHI
jgi:hypothetical protein